MVPAASFVSSDATASHRFAEKRRWIARSSRSDVPCRYASISWPVPVVRSGLDLGGGCGCVSRPRSSAGSLVVVASFVSLFVPPPLFLILKLFFLGGISVYSPGNLHRSMDMPFVVRCSVRSSVCVVLPDLSRPSMTINAPRTILLMISLQGRIQCY